MRYVKALVIVFLFFMAMMFFVQNQNSFSGTVTLKLDLLFFPPMESIPLPLYSVMLCCFGIGALLVLAMLMWDRMAISTRLMNARRKASGFEKKIVKLEAELANINEKHEAEIVKVKAQLEETEKRLDVAMRSA